MADSKKQYARAQPAILDFGSNYVGAVIQGSFQILPATECRNQFSFE